ncbi:23S rRNA (adenine(1618)-N(6))-methyltransferase RlmF [Shewanella intestini]|uniref:Ribosomal RNA large subunit methyltransferase F n=3 Tax=Shewanella intestini TaxID=2017544 RepID=A0ABS5I630_9GAMM|nr:MULTISPECIES: 23S rRNA (adenine(1618)-N(6))-methyltransferase RlmF [Shewanella]MBR9729303.1 23S rRNA (adenine(1618)-N(6))-methyltransferase RlmF [Shewanella intestini]MRG37382.1 23S rRNA (adenine(1618)-N(6))-methyltransferase RlmF [Shewanella sp. XMDDZSB0408]
MGTKKTPASEPTLTRKLQVKRATAQSKKSSKTITAKPTTALSKTHSVKKAKAAAPVLTSKGLHPLNKHRHGYDFTALALISPKLNQYVQLNQYGNLSIDFSDPQAVKALNAALLAEYGVQQWDIPNGFLCPPIPGRVDYLYYLADLLGQSNNQSKKVSIIGLDIGTGANGIYPFLGIKQFHWQFVASDIDTVSLDNVAKIAKANQLTSAQLSLRHQGDASAVFNGIIAPTEHYDFTMCNPPFHRSLAEATAGSQKKLANLAANRQSKQPRKATTSKTNVLNFGGQKAELWCEGGELQFMTNMINESVRFAGQVRWFTSLISKSEHLKPCKVLLAKCKAVQVKEIEMKQGNKITRILAWSFLDLKMQQQWRKLKRG